MIVRPTAQTLLALLVFHTVACGNEDADAVVVVGLTTDIAVGFQLDRVVITTQVNGVSVESEDLSYDSGKLQLPAEHRLSPVHDDAALDVSITAFRDADVLPFLTRTATTRAIGGRTLFLPLSLDEACAGITCASGATCVKGACEDSSLSPSLLRDYDPAWIITAPDACKTQASGGPTVEIGKGQTTFATLATDETLPLEAGPQGGHHVWLALRVSGVRQMGSTLTLGGTYPELGVTLAPSTSMITLRKIMDGHCEIYGIRFQVDRGIPVDTIRGQNLDMEMGLKDPNGDGFVVNKRFNIAP